MNLQRAKASNLQSQITESTSRGAREAQDEINVLRADLADAQQKLVQSEDRLKKQKKNQENLELRARRADDLEAEVLRLTKLKTGDAELNKNLDKKMDQLDLRKQNASCSDSWKSSSTVPGPAESLEVAAAKREKEQEGR